VKQIIFVGRARRLTVLAFSLLAVPLLGQNPNYQPDPNWHTPMEAASRSNPLASRTQAAAGGRKLFIRNCVECHGKDGTGIDKKHSADLQLPIVQQQTDGALFWKITNGNTGRGMPSFSKLPDLQRWQLVLYIRTLKQP
jgi:mono/diheme cytochrome c family protein